MPPLKTYTFVLWDKYPSVKIVIEAYNKSHADDLLYWAIGQNSFNYKLIHHEK